jgi:hypothetical protein
MTRLFFSPELHMKFSLMPSKKYGFAAIILVAIASAAGLAWAKSDAHTQQDIARHRAMATAHEAMAKCLEGGKKYDICLKDLQTACKDLGIGKHCGMKHVH